MCHQNFFAKNCKILLISSLIYAGGGGSLEAFAKLNSWPADFMAPTDSAYLEIGGKKFENIPSKAFKDATWIEDLSFDSAVKSIGCNAFENCTALTSIMFPSNLTQIDSAAFKGCTAIKEITLPEQLKSIASEAFSGTQLTSIVFPSSLKHLGTQAFSHCQFNNVHYKNQSQNFVINSTCFFGPNCSTLFAGNQNLKELIVLDGVTQIPENAFAGCSNLRYVSFPSTLTAVGLGAFDSCTNLEFIDYGKRTNVQDLLLDTMENGKVVGKTLFAGPSEVGGKHKGNLNLKEIHVLRGSLTLGESAFRGCSNLINISLPNSLTSIGHWSLSGTSIKSIILPNSITYIDGSAFRGCRTLQIINLPDAITYINGYAFRQCSGIRSITLPRCIVNISVHAFDDCSSLSIFNISKISLEATNSIDWSAAFAGSGGLNRITKVTCRQEQVEKVQATFPNAALEIVDQQG